MPVPLFAEYEVVGAVVDTGKGHVALFFGLPPCGLSFCPQLHRTNVRVRVPGNVTVVEALVHVPEDQVRQSRSARSGVCSGST